MVFGVVILNYSVLLTCPKRVFSYSKDFSNWDRYRPHNVDRTMPVDVCKCKISLSLSSNRSL